MKTRKIGVLYPDESHFNLAKDPAAATIGAPGLSSEVFSNRRQVQGTLTAKGTMAINSAKVTLEGLTGLKLKLKWSLYAGCSACPCSPGFEIIEQVAPQTSVWRLKDDERISIFLGADDIRSAQCPKFGPFSYLSEKKTVAK